MKRPVLNKIWTLLSNGLDTGIVNTFFLIFLCFSEKVIREYSENKVDFRLGCGVNENDSLAKETMYKLGRRMARPIYICRRKYLFFKCFWQFQLDFSTEKYFSMVATIEI